MLLRHRIAFLSLLLVAIALLAIAFVSARTLSLVEPAAHAIESIKPGPAPAQTNSKREGPEAEVIAFKTNGFEPAEITRPRDPFLLVIDNRSGIEVSSFEIRHEDGSLRHSMQSRRHKLSWQQMLDLPPGRYLLQAPDHRGLFCRLNITAR